VPGLAVPEAMRQDASATSLVDARTPASGRGDGGFDGRDMTSSFRALTRAREALGAPFRLHGRDLRGMDCVGLVAWAWDVPAPTGYALRASPVARIERELAALGFVVGMAPGAIVIIAPGAGQLHLGISTGRGLIHADAVARRVVERDAPLPWPILAGWIREA
jgi:cell wall-associated NlpC family hydrolase